PHRGAGGIALHAEIDVRQRGRLPQRPQAQRPPIVGGFERRLEVDVAAEIPERPPRRERPASCRSRPHIGLSADLMLELVDSEAATVRGGGRRRWARDGQAADHTEYAHEASRSPARLRRRASAVTQNHVEPGTAGRGRDSRNRPTNTSAANGSDSSRGRAMVDKGRESRGRSFMVSFTLCLRRVLKLWRWTPGRPSRLT